MLKHAEMNRASEDPVASTDKEKCIASTSCLLFRGFQGHQKRVQASSLRRKKFHQPHIDPGTAHGKTPLNPTSLYEICPEQVISVLLPMLPAFHRWSKYGGHNGFHACRGNSAFQGMVLGRSLQSSAAVSVELGKEEDTSGRTAATGLC